MTRDAAKKIFFNKRESDTSSDAAMKLKDAYSLEGKL